MCSRSSDHSSLCPSAQLLHTISRLCACKPASHVLSPGSTGRLQYKLHAHGHASNSKMIPVFCQTAHFECRGVHHTLTLLKINFHRQLDGAASRSQSGCLSVVNVSCFALVYICLLSVQAKLVCTWRTLK